MQQAVRWQTAAFHSHSLFSLPFYITHHLPPPLFENRRNLKKAKDFCTPLLYDDCLEFWCWLGNEDVGWMDSGLYIQCLLYVWPILSNNMHTYVRRQSFHFFHFWQSTLLFCCCCCSFFCSSRRIHISTLGEYFIIFVIATHTIASFIFIFKENYTILMVYL